MLEIKTKNKLRELLFLSYKLYIYLFFNRFHHIKEDGVEIIHFCAKILSAIGREKSKLMWHLIIRVLSGRL